MKKKDCSHKHKNGAVTKFCIDCGEVVNADARVNPNCKENHFIYKSWGHKFCPDCGKKL